VPDKTALRGVALLAALPGSGPTPRKTWP